MYVACRPQRFGKRIYELARPKMLFCFDKFCYKLAKLCDVAVLVKWHKPNGIYPNYIQIPKHLESVLLSRCFSVC